MAFVGACVSRVPRGPGLVVEGGRIRSAAAAEEEEEDDGAKTGPEPNPSLPLFLTDTNSLKSLLPEVLLTVASHPKGS